MKENSILTIQVLECKSCRKRYVPPKYHCNNCGNDEFKKINLKGLGKVYSYTVIRMPFEEFLQDAPYTFAEILLDGGVVMPGRFNPQEATEVEIGSKVVLTGTDRNINWFEML